MLKIPATPAEWAAIVPNAVDLAIAREGWKAGHAGGHSIRARVAAASRLHEFERCVAALAKLFESQGGPYRDDPVVEARRILGVSDE